MFFCLFWRVALRPVVDFQTLGEPKFFVWYDENAQIPKQDCVMLLILVFKMKSFRLLGRRAKFRLDVCHDVHPQLPTWNSFNFTPGCLLSFTLHWSQAHQMNAGSAYSIRRARVTHG